MWFPIQTLAQIFSDIMLDADHTQQTSVYIFQCEPMFARAAIGYVYAIENIGKM